MNPGRCKMQGTCLGSLKTEQAIRCCWVRESASTHPSPHGISSAAGTDPNCFGCEFIKKCDFVPSVCYAPARCGAPHTTPADIGILIHLFFWFLRAIPMRLHAFTELAKRKGCEICVWYSEHFSGLL